MHASETPLIHIFDPRAEGGDQNRCCFIDLALQIENLDAGSERVEANRIEFNEEVTSLQERLLGDLRVARGLKAKLAVANEVLKSQDDLENVTEAFEESMQLLDGEIPNYIKNLL